MRSWRAALSTLLERPTSRSARPQPPAPRPAPDGEPARAQRVPRSGHITAAPNPVLLRDGLLPPQTTAYWTSEGTEVVEVHVGAPDGALLSRSGPGTGRERTGEWVVDGLVLHLQDVSGGRPLTAENTLATVRLDVRPGGLDAEDAP